jgi:virginiamycin B lyase
MVRAGTARVRVWSVVGLLAAVAALALVFVTVLGPRLGIQLFTPQPTVVPIHLADPRYSIVATAAAPDGSLWFTEERYQSTGPNSWTDGPARVGHATADGKLAEYPLPAGNTFGPDPITNGTIVVGPDGRLWFVEWQGGLIHTAAPHDAIAAIGPDGAISEYSLPFATWNFFQPGLVTPLVLGPDGNLWFAARVAAHLGSTSATTPTVDMLARITPAGAITAVPLAHVPVGAQLDGHLTLGPDGNFWSGVDLVGAQGNVAGTDIARITPAGAVTSYSTPTAGAGAFGYFAGGDGNVWFFDVPIPGGAAKIGRVTPTGELAEYPLPSGSPYSTLVRNGSDLWFLLAGVEGSCSSAATCQLAGTIGRITPTGAMTEYPIPTPNVLGIDLTAGHDGDLYFVETARRGTGLLMGNDRLGRITPSGRIVELTVQTHQGGDFQLVAGAGDTLWLTGSPALGQTGTSFILRITPPRG